MSCVNITIPFPVEDAELLAKEAKKQGRTFSGYIQTILNQYLKPIVRKRVIIKRRK